MTYEYMRALQQCFGVSTRHSPLRQKVDSIHQELTQTLSKGGRRKLLRIIDLEDTLHNQAIVANFAAGFKLACGISQELGTPCLFERDWR